MCDAFRQQCFQLIIIVVVGIIIMLNTNIEIESSKQSPNLLCISLGEIEFNIF
jgi:hypothetical protein